MPERNNVMGKAVTMGQFLSGIAGLILTFGTLIWNFATTTTRIIERQATQAETISRQGQELKELRSTLEQHNQKIDEKIDGIRSDISDIKVLLQNKQDRQ
jgi:hypothetical protein